MSVQYKANNTKEKTGKREYIRIYTMDGMKKIKEDKNPTPVWRRYCSSGCDGEDAVWDIPLALPFVSRKMFSKTTKALLSN